MHKAFSSCNDAFPILLRALQRAGVQRPSRNGPVVEYPEPVMASFDEPLHRVLFCPHRDINPFLHFFEPLWILAGRNDVGFLSNIVKRFADYSDDGVTLAAAYGYRLRHPIDQIKLAINRLKLDPDDRRAVLQIRLQEEMAYNGKDTACNIAIALKVRSYHSSPPRLDIHVFNRSNDAIWGGPAGGANYPQFTVLQEYLAAHIGVEVGRYTHTTDSMHAYIENPQYQKLLEANLGSTCRYEDERIKPFPLFRNVGDVRDWDADLNRFFQTYDGLMVNPAYRTDFFNLVVLPMWRCFRAYKAKNKMPVATIHAQDWRTYLYEWAERRGLDFEGAPT